jgi:hypothetical protein
VVSVVRTKELIVRFGGDANSPKFFVGAEYQFPLILEAQLCDLTTQLPNLTYDYVWSTANSDDDFSREIRAEIAALKTRNLVLPA